MRNVMRIETVKFRRSKNRAEELGVLINEGDGPILDFEGNSVTDVWDYRKFSNTLVTIQKAE